MSELGRPLDSKRAISFTQLNKGNLKASSTNLSVSKNNLTQSKQGLGSTNLSKSSNKLSSSSSNLNKPDVVRKSLHNLILDVEEKLKIVSENFDQTRKSEESLERLSNESLNNTKTEPSQAQKLHLTSLADVADVSIDQVNILAPPKRVNKKVAAAEPESEKVVPLDPKTIRKMMKDVHSTTADDVRSFTAQKEMNTLKAQNKMNLGSMGNLSKSRNQLSGSKDNLSKSKQNIALKEA